MAAVKRFTVEQIVAKLREAEKLQAQGLTIPLTLTRFDGYLNAWAAIAVNQARSTSRVQRLRMPLT